MRRLRKFGFFQSHQKVKKQQGSSTCLLFSGNDENHIKNGAILLEVRVALFGGNTNPIRCFSVDDLNLMNVNNVPIIEQGYYQSHAGVWDGKLVLVKIFPGSEILGDPCLEIAVATQMGSHRNVLRLLGCCLDTDKPVLVYEWPEHGNLDDQILSYNEEGHEPVEWKERLRIGWAIAHAVAYLHTAFRRPIIHRDLKPKNVFLDQTGAARLSDFGLSISIPEGETYVEDIPIGTYGYVAPDYVETGMLATSTDVYTFGVLLLVLLTGKPALGLSKSDDKWIKLLDWVRDRGADNCLSEIVDPTMTAAGAESEEHFQRDLKSFLELSLWCTSEEEESRPTMVDVATRLKNMIRDESDDNESDITSEEEESRPTMFDVATRLTNMIRDENESDIQSSSTGSGLLEWIWIFIFQIQWIYKCFWILIWIWKLLSRSVDYPLKIFIKNKNN